MRAFAGLRRSSSSLLSWLRSLMSGYDSGPKRAFADSGLIAIEAELAIETELVEKEES